jgi:hypothetical protein
MMTQRPSLLETDQELLELLHNDPRQTPSMLLKGAESTESKQYVQDRLEHLRDHNLAQRPDRGIYELTERGGRAAANLDLYRGDDRDAFWERVDS